MKPLIPALLSKDCLRGNNVHIIRLTLATMIMIIMIIIMITKKHSLQNWYNQISS